MNERVIAELKERHGVGKEIQPAEEAQQQTTERGDLPLNIRATSSPDNTEEKLLKLKADWRTTCSTFIQGIFNFAMTTYWFMALIDGTALNFISSGAIPMLLGFSAIAIPVSIVLAAFLTLCDRKIHQKQNTLGQELENISVPKGAKLKSGSQFVLTGSTLADAIALAGTITACVNVFAQSAAYVFPSWAELAILSGAFVVGIFAVQAERRTHKKVLLQSQVLESQAPPSAPTGSGFFSCWKREAREADVNTPSQTATLV